MLSKPIRGGNFSFKQKIIKIEKRIKTQSHVSAPRKIARGSQPVVWIGPLLYGNTIPTQTQRLLRNSNIPRRKQFTA